MKMSRLFATLALAMTVGLQTYAEDKAQTLALNVNESAPIIPEYEAEADEKFGSERFVLQLEYLSGENYISEEDKYSMHMDGVGVSVSGGNAVWGLEFYKGKTNETITTNWAWSFFAGWQGRHFFSKEIFIEGKVVGKWWDSTCKSNRANLDEHGNVTSYTEETNNDAYFALVASPRVGVIFCKSIAVTAGYFWQFNEFKIYETPSVKGFTVGVDVAF